MIAPSDKTGGGHLGPSPAFSVHDRIRSWTSIVSSIAACIGICIGIFQIRKIYETISVNNTRELKASTLRVVESWQSAQLISARKEINLATTKKGNDAIYDYRKLTPETVFAIRTVMNTLEIAAIGARNGSYDRQMVYDYFHAYIVKFTEAFLLGKNGVNVKVNDKITLSWILDTDTESPTGNEILFPGKGEYENIRWLYDNRNPSDD